MEARTFVRFKSLNRLFPVGKPTFHEGVIRIFFPGLRRKRHFHFHGLTTHFTENKIFFDIMFDWVSVEKSVSKKSMKKKQATSLQLTSWKDLGMAYFLELTTWRDPVSQTTPLASLLIPSYFFAHPLLLLCSSPLTLWPWQKMALA